MYNFNIQNGLSLGVSMYLHMIALMLILISLYVNIIYPNCTLRNSRKNKAVHYSYIKKIILYASIFITKRFTKKMIILNSQLKVKNGKVMGCVDFAIKKIIGNVNEKLITIIEGKQKDLVIYAKVMQLKNSYYMNMKKRKASKVFDNKFDYLYEIVTTGIIFF